ncbi:MAG TPA: protein kinase [Polyangiaceae bacterium]|nr:protein kinase [Polyangiaceae bacterium]
MRQGDLIAGRYRVVRRVGSGGMGTVYEALDGESSSPVALKTLRVDADLEVRARTRLLREAYALSEVRHPAVVRYVDHGTSPEHGPFLVMAWVVGETLDERLRAGGLTPVDALAIVRRLASGLSAVHARGVVHRDLKPGNVMLPGGDVTQAVLVDFGVARVGSGVTGTGDHVGTPRYMAPEQIRSARSVDDRTDVFALGCILFECLTGALAFEGADPVTVLARILFEPLPVPSVRRADLPPSLDALVARMLDRDGARRPTAAAVDALAADVLSALDPRSRALGSPGRRRSEDRESRPLDRTAPWETSDDLGPPSFRLDTLDPFDAVRSGLPWMPGAFVGREEEQVRLLEALRTRSPVVTVWGGAGIGKTRLAIETLRRAVEARDPRWDALVYAELGDARDTDDVVRTLATAARVSLESSGAPEMALASALGKLGQCVLVLDRVEHLDAIVGTLVRAFRREAPRLQVIATSRRKGCPPGALAFELGPLPSGGSLGGPSPAATLLLDRAGLASRDLDASAVERAELIARALDGNPLAIEVSAPSAQILGLEGLLARATRGAGDLGAVQGPMRSALERSHDLLSGPERAAFAQCAVFRGGFSFDAAEAVVRVPGPTVLALVQALREHSLLTARTLETGAEVRLAMPAAVRELAWEKLRASPEARPALRRHAAHYASTHARSAGGPSGDALARLEHDADNLLAAAEFSLSEDDGEAAAGFGALAALEPVIVPRGAVAGYLKLLDDAIARAEGGAAAATLAAKDAKDATDLRSIRARFDGPAGRTARARADLAKCLDEVRRAKDPVREGLVLLDLGVIHHLDHDWLEARRLYEAALERLRRIDDPWALGRCLGNIGALRHDDGDLKGASALYRQAIALLEQAGESRRRANFTANLALIEQELGDTVAAHALFERALSLLEPIRDARLLAIALGNLGLLELEMGRAPRAVERYERALALLAGSGDTRSRTLCLARLAAALAGVGRPALADTRIAQAERLAEGASPVLIEIVLLARAFVDLAPDEDGRVIGSNTGLISARERIDRALAARHGDRPLHEQSDDVRSMLRILGRLIAQRAGVTVA